LFRVLSRRPSRSFRKGRMAFFLWVFRNAFRRVQEEHDMHGNPSPGPGKSPRLLLVDNYDSFTYNLYQAFLVLGARVEVRRNDREEIFRLAREVDGIVISPGPGGPGDAGLSKRLVEKTAGDPPLLGVCLGMQCINEVFGGRTVRAPVPVHGKTSPVFHDGSLLYRGIPSPFTAARYHSLAVEPAPHLVVTARTAEGVPMSLGVPGRAVWGVQYHPESFLTPHGPRVLENFLAACREREKAHGKGGIP